MYLRRCYRRKDGKRDAYCALVESRRTVRGPRQQVVAYLGVLEEAARLGAQEAVDPHSQAQRELFAEAEPEWVSIDVKRVRVERSLTFGGAWLG
ncbi:MAG: IS1634 family transposase, partial [Bryobacteraceae bacterium]